MAAELTRGGVDSACHPSEVGKMSASILVIEGIASENDATSSHKAALERKKNDCVNEINQTVRPRSHLPRRPWGLQNLWPLAIIGRPQYFHGHTM